MAKKGNLFRCTLADISNGASHGCQFFNWLLDEEVISRQSFLAHSPNNLPTSDPYWKVLNTLQDTAMWVPNFLGEVQPQNTLRNLDSDTATSLQDHRLFAATYQATGSALDISKIDFFGLWNPVTVKIDCRTRTGLVVCTEAEDPAASTITTRPIEEYPAAGKTVTKISSWLQSCRNGHTKCQKMSTTMPGRLLEIDATDSKRTLRLLDTKNLDSVEYIALSYCWGREQSVTCTKSTLPKLQVSILVSDLPSTIQDAVTVCDELSIAYLWVDALCIIQDDQYDKTTEIAKMPYIYGNASLTIAAASSRTVDDGFLHQRAVTSPTAFKLSYRCHDNVLGSVTIFILDTTPEPLDERGWTLQERLLSKRFLQFGSRSTRWYCHESGQTSDQSDGWMSQPEYSPLGRDTVDIVNFHRISDFHPAKDYGYIRNHWGNVIKAYTQRKLTKLTDRPHAIAGISEVFAQLFHNRYRAGLWTCSMHADLLWEISPNTRVPRPTVYQGPTWSWIGVNGAVDFGSFNVNDWRATICQAQILDIECEPVNDQALFGAIKPTSGLLKLRARMAKGARVVSNGSDPSNRNEKFLVGFLGQNGAGACIAMAKMSSDAIEEDFSDTGNNSDEANAIEVLEIQSRIKGASWQCRGLVLRAVPNKQGWFRRVGTFQYQTNRDGQKDGESDEDWETRVALEFDWFRHQAYSIVTII